MKIRRPEAQPLLRSTSREKSEDQESEDEEQERSINMKERDALLRRLSLGGKPDTVLDIEAPDYVIINMEPSVCDVDSERLAFGNAELFDVLPLDGCVTYVESPEYSRPSKQELQDCLRSLSQFSSLPVNIQQIRKVQSSHSGYFNSSQQPKQMRWKARFLKSLAQLMTTDDGSSERAQNIDGFAHYSLLENSDTSPASVEHEHALLVMRSWLEKQEVQIPGKDEFENETADEKNETELSENIENESKKRVRRSAKPVDSTEHLESIDLERLNLDSVWRIPGEITERSVNFNENVSLDNVVEEQSYSFNIRYILPEQKNGSSVQEILANRAPVFSIDNALGLATGRHAWDVYRNDDDMLLLQYSDEYSVSIRRYRREGLDATEYNIKDIISGQIEIVGDALMLNEIERKINNDLGVRLNEEDYQSWMWMNQGKENAREFYVTRNMSIPDSAQGDVIVSFLPGIDGKIHIDQLTAAENSFSPPLLHEVVGNRDIFYKPDRSFRLILRNDDSQSLEHIEDIKSQIRKLNEEDMASFLTDSRSEISTHPDVNLGLLLINPNASTDKKYNIARPETNVRFESFPLHNVMFVFDQPIHRSRISFPTEVLLKWRGVNVEGDVSFFEITAPLSTATIKIVVRSMNTDLGGGFDSVIEDVLHRNQLITGPILNLRQQDSQKTVPERWDAALSALNHYPQWVRDKAANICSFNYVASEFTDDEKLQKWDEFKKYALLVYRMTEKSYGFRYDEVAQSDWPEGDFEISGKKYNTEYIDDDNVLAAWFRFAREAHLKDQEIERQSLALINERQRTLVQWRQNPALIDVSLLESYWRDVPKQAQALEALFARLERREGFSQARERYQSLESKALEASPATVGELKKAKDDMVSSLFNAMFYESASLTQTSNREQASEWYGIVQEFIDLEIQKRIRPFQEILDALGEPTSSSDLEKNNIRILKIDNVNISIGNSRFDWETAQEIATWVGIGVAVVVFIGTGAVLANAITASAGGLLIGGATLVGAAAFVPMLVVSGGIVPLAGAGGASAVGLANVIRGLGFNANETVLSRLEGGGIVLMSGSAFAQAKQNIEQGNYGSAALDVGMGVLTIATGAPLAKNIGPGVKSGGSAGESTHIGPAGSQFDDGALPFMDSDSVTTVNNIAPMEDFSLPEDDSWTSSLSWQKLQLLKENVGNASTSDMIALGASAGIPSVATVATVMPTSVAMPESPSEKTFWEIFSESYRRGPRTD